MKCSDGALDTAANTVLVVDNDREDCRRYEHSLTREGLHACPCESAEEALRLLVSGETPWAAAIVLWEIPSPSGDAFFGDRILRECAELCPGMPVVAMVRTRGADSLLQAARAGAKEVVQKPFDVESLGKVLREVLEEHRQVPRLMAALRMRLIGDSPKFLSMLRDVAIAIEHGAREVLLLGESGTGKDVLARAIHELSEWRDKPFVHVNMSVNVLTGDQLFGHVRGAFTGAEKERAGHFETAGEGTVFLDEIGNLDPELQGFLLGVLQSRRFHRIGSSADQCFEGQVICATNAALVQMVNDGRFRNDLYFRIRRLVVELPPLRVRQGDKALLFQHFLEKYGGARGIRFLPEVLEYIRDYEFPGNVRELEYAVEHAVTVCRGNTLRTADFIKVLSQSPTVASREKEEDVSNGVPIAAPMEAGISEFAHDLTRDLPRDLMSLDHKTALALIERAADRVLLMRRYAEANHNLTQAAKEAGLDPKTFRKRLRDATGGKGGAQGV